MQHDIDEVDGLQQYTRVNNIEIVGLDGEPNGEESVEEMVLECLNGLVENNGEKFTAPDIDICHILPKANRSHTHVVRFVSRKSKIDVMNLKKEMRNKKFKFRNKDIYFNEHLTSKNKNLFNLAKQKQNANNYKFLWTRNGKIFLRKTENSAVIKIDSEDIINSL